MSGAVLGALISGLFAIGGVVYVQRVTAKLSQQNRVDAGSVERQRIEAEAYRRAEASNAESLRIANGNIKQLEARMVAAENRAEQADAMARRCTEELETERRSRRVDAERQTEEVTRRLEEGRRALRAAENRERDHAAEIRRLWVIVNALRDEIRRAGIPVPEELLVGGIGTLPDDTAPHNTWSEHSKDQDQE